MSAVLAIITTMRVSGRQKSIAFFITLGACLVAVAVALNISWILLNWRQVALLIFGIPFFIAIIAGLVLNTIFLVREIRRNEQHDSFINAVTHELKTPIASIRLYLETLQSREVDPAKRQEFYNIMLSDSNRLLYTVEQVLKAGQVGQRKRSTNRQVVNLAELTKAAVDTACKQHHLAEGSIAYSEKFFNGNDAAVLGDPDELRAAVTNLLDNAVKYSDKQMQIAVTVLTDVDNHVTVRVSDKGIGIPKAQLKNIFKRFYRVPGRMMSRIKGTGLGLFIVYSVIKKTGGKVFAESEGEGKGSTFTIKLPGIQQ
ncbi:MAG TPA: HAMP domain-containing sensor histidine kinase [Blastocatellia bacterium]|nr:HAMP domain-containing sensor histidine kinase [Blastocatellia bacterium]